MADCKHAELSLLVKGFGAKQQNFVHCRCGLTWKVNAKGNRLVTTVTIRKPVS
jgi:hypothetical protein